MPAVRPTTALSAIEAVVLDTETTGLDARKARIVQLAAVLVRADRIVEGELLDTLVAPGIPIPPETTAIHGITDAAVAASPPFRDVAPAFHRFVDGRLLIGHSLAYDLAVLKREHELAGLAWQAPRALDVRTLAKLAAPSLADHSLDRLADWLGIRIEGRHTAIGDTMATARVFLALVPRLREAGIRTLAEATAASARLAEQEARASRGLMVAEAEPGAAERAPLIDSFAYRHRARDVMSAPALFVDGEASIASALRLVLDRGTSSAFVRLPAGAVGIVTERDILRAVAAEPADGLAAPVASIAKTPVQGVDEDDFLYRAIGRMARLGFRHLAVRDAAGTVTGALTPRNLLRDRAMQAIVIGDAIGAATSSGELAAAWSETPVLAAALRRDGVEARAVAATLSAEIQAITARAASLAEAEMAAAGKAGPPAPYTVLVLGSAGRGESLLAADQDNALVYASGAEDGPEDRWFAEMAGIMNRILDEAGIVLCKGEVMARNKLWRHSLAGWKTLVEGWIRRQKPQDLLNVDIFFDAIPVTGDRALGDSLMRFAREQAGASPSFLLTLSELARQWRSPLAMFGGFHKVDGRVDLKKGGLMPLFTGARVLDLRHGLGHRSTRERIEAFAALGLVGAADCPRLVEAHETLLAAILGQQIEDAERGVPLSPRIVVERLSADERQRLKSAIQAVTTMQGLVSEGRI